MFGEVMCPTSGSEVSIVSRRVSEAVSTGRCRLPHLDELDYWGVHMFLLYEIGGRRWEVDSYEHLVYVTIL